MSSPINDLLSQYGESSVSPNTSASPKNKLSNGDLGKDQFLTLLVTQLQYQDPLNPASDTEFVAQMAQFSALEQMQNLNTTFNVSQAHSLIDKYVEGVVTNSSTGESKAMGGIVKGVKIVNGEPFLVIGKSLMKVSDVDTVVSDLLTDVDAPTEAIGALGDKVEDIEKILETALGVSADDSDDSDDQDSADEPDDTED